MAAMAAALMSCGPASPPSAAETAARQLQVMVGGVHGPITVESVEVEGDLVVITLDGEANWRQGYPSFMITAAFLRRLCEEHRGSFRGGSVGLRIDTLEAGAHRIAGAPAPLPGSMTGRRQSLGRVTPFCPIYLPARSA